MPSRLEQRKHYDEIIQKLEKIPTLMDTLEKTQREIEAINLSKINPETWYMAKRHVVNSYQMELALPNDDTEKALLKIRQRIYSPYDVFNYAMELEKEIEGSTQFKFNKTMVSQLILSDLKKNYQTVKETYNTKSEESKRVLKLFKYSPFYEKKVL